MIYRTLDELIGSENDVRAPTFHSRRLLLKSDGMGFSFHDTILFAGSETYIWYANHLEAVYCIEGEGELETVDDGKIYPIHPGVFYALDKHDKHYLRAKSQLRMMCVFNPPLTGREVHDAQGTYPLVE